MQLTAGIVFLGNVCEKLFRRYLLYLLVLWGVSIQDAFPQLVVSTGMPPAQMVQNVLVGSGVNVSNVTYSGSVNSIGVFSTGTLSTNLGLTNGIILSTGDVGGSSVVVPGSPVWDFASTSIGTGSDPQLASLIPGYSIFDAVVLQFDFVPLSDTIKFRYVFGSEEYPEWVNSSYNDVFGFFVSGQNPLGGNYFNKNIALIPGTNLPVTIDNVNNVTPSYPQFYVDNEGMNGATIVYDGFTKVLTAWALVVPCQTYHIKIAIGDAGDDVYDSAVFLEANSFSTNAIAASVQYSAQSIDTAAIEGCTSATVGFKLASPTNLPMVINYTIGGTAQNGIDYLPIPTSLTVPAGQDSVGFIINPVVDGINEGVETVVINLQGIQCGAMTSITVYIKDNSEVFVSAGNDTMVCGGFVTLSASVSGGISPVNYAWSNGVSNSSSILVNPPVTTTYTVTVTDACGSQNTDDVIVYFGSGGLINAGKDTIICEGGTATLMVNGNVNCLWSNGVNGVLNVVSPLITTTYGAYIITPCDTLIDSVTVFVEKMPEALFSALNTSGCKPLETHFSNLSLNASQNVSYLWEFGDGSVSSLPNPSHIYNAPGFYDVSLTVYNSSYCYDKLTFYSLVEVFPSPTAQFITNPIVASSFDPSIYFLDYSAGYPISWLWSLGDGDSAFVPNFQHYYADTGKYIVSLLVTNSYGCSDSISYVVTIKPDNTMYVPNAFTPDNNDDLNQFFRAYGEGIISFKMLIFNRWGQRIFESDNIERGWNGMFAGEKAPAGVYVYKIRYGVAENKFYTKYGRVTLIR